jgi:hypothetical protein
VKRKNRASKVAQIAVAAAAALAGSRVGFDFREWTMGRAWHELQRGAIPAN